MGDRAEEGGHKSIHPQLGTLEDFHQLVAKAEEQGLEIAFDIAFQCTPDHPYVKDHPEWFRKRPDGSIQYAENPPKKYQDIYPFDFESEDWQELWHELKSILIFWIEQGVRIFRVDNPHTKAFPFWEWVIAEIRREYPDVIFLAEAFTRPKVMYRLAKLGFSQSYTYFAWRNTAGADRVFHRAYPDARRRIFPPQPLAEHAGHTDRVSSIWRAPRVHGALGACGDARRNYGIYGPAFELCENVAREPGSEEFLNSEKYQLRHWDLAKPDSLKEIIALVNRIRRDNPALHDDWSLSFTRSTTIS